MKISRFVRKVFLASVAVGSGVILGLAISLVAMKSGDEMDLLRAVDDLADLQLALLKYHKYYQHYPFCGSGQQDRLFDTGKEGPLIPALSGRDKESNQDQINFFPLNRNLENKTELRDPWGSPYYVLLDCDEDKVCVVPGFEGTSIPEVAIWSKGPPHIKNWTALSKP